MRRSIIIIWAVILVAACTTAENKMPTSLSYRQQLDGYKDMKIRLFQVGHQVRQAVPVACPVMKKDTGVLTHQLSDYPPRMRTVAAGAWGLDDTPTPMFDMPVDDGKICAVPMTLTYNPNEDAYTDGQSVFISPHLMNTVDDEDDVALALVLAHELAHIALNHGDKPQSEALERQADRLALFTLARANLNYRKAITQFAATRQPNQTHPKFFKKALCVVAGMLIPSFGERLIVIFVRLPRFCRH
mgnify:CR=1 FL=1